MYYVATILAWNLQSGSHYQSASPLMYRRSPFMSRGGNKFSSTTAASTGGEVTLPPFNPSHPLNASHSDDSDEVESQNLLPHLMPRMSGRQRLNPGLATNAIIFCLLFVKDHWFGANQWPLIGGEGIVLFVPSTISLLMVSGPLEGFLSWHDALQGPSTTPCLLLPELWINKDNVKCAMLGVGWKSQDHQLTQTLKVCFLKKHSVLYWSLIVKSH